MMPEYARPKPKKYNTATANGLTMAILTWCKLNNIYATRLSSEGRYRPGKVVTDVLGRQRQMKGRWLPGLNTGLPDIIIILKGRFIGVEVKTGKDRQSDIQKATQEKIEKAGGVYLIVKDYEQFQTFINRHLQL
jgi:hypothetical protein